jgi:hypothetical protein
MNPTDLSRSSQPAASAALVPTLATALAAVLAGLALALCAAPADAQPAAPCWATNVMEPITSDDLRITDPRFAPLHRAMDQLEAVARANAGLNTLPEVRLRLRREINDAWRPSEQPYNAALHAHGFGPKAWGRGDCEVIPQADRLGARAGISFFINSPLATLNRWAHDEQLTAYLEGERSEPMQGWPVFRGCAVITASKRLWWLPVTVGEMLDFYAREQPRRVDDFDQRNRRHFDEPYDLAAAEARIAEMRRVHGAAGEKPAEMALLAARQRKALEPQFLHQLQQSRATLVAELDGLRAARAALTPAAAAEPYRLGSGRYRLPTESEAHKPLKRVVKLDPSFPWDGRQRMRVQAIHVCPSLLDKNPSYGPPMREAVRDLDFKRIAALLN